MLLGTMAAMDAMGPFVNVTDDEGHPISYPIRGKNAGP